MSDIVRFLRAEWDGRDSLNSHNEIYMADLCRRAADEIERLRLRHGPARGEHCTCWLCTGATGVARDASHEHR